jgi:hypothetical protein
MTATAKAKAKQIPFGDDNQKGNDNRDGNDYRNGYDYGYGCGLRLGRRSR